MKISSILGLNARSQLYSYPYNTSQGKKIARSKLLTKRLLKANGIATPELYAKFKNPQDLLNFKWVSLPDSFALKPSKGFGGEGIIVVKKKLDNNKWLTVKREKISLDEIKLHILDILEGAFSIDNTPDVAYIEEYIGRHKSLRKYSYRGTPDIRVIVFNKVPVMAMLRLPTKESGGRANLHQGAIAAGIDIATGITTKATWHDESITFKPGTKNRKLRGIKIPNWNKVLSIASNCQIVSKLGYLGVDIVMHPEKGPMILEINSQPGLRIQLANEAGLRKRLERVDELNVRNAEHGINIAKALFSASFADRVKNLEDSAKTISAIEHIVIFGADKRRKKVVAKIDTGAWRTSISQSLAEDLGLLHKNNILWTKRFKSSLGMEERPVINLTFKIAGRKISTPASVAKRAALRYPVIIGRKNLKGMLIDPHVKDLSKIQKT